MIEARVMNGNKVVKTVKSEMFFETADLKALVAKYTEPVVTQHVRASLTIAAQSYMRSLASPKRKPTLTDTQVQAELKNWKPGVSNRKPKDPVKSRQDLVKRVTRLSDDDKAVLMAMLSGKSIDTEKAIIEVSKRAKVSNKTAAKVVKLAAKRKAA